MTEEEKREYLISHYPVEDRYKNILIQIQDVLEALEVMDIVDINTDLLGQAIFDYFEDIDKLKKFEDIDKINVDKIYSYLTFWLLRRKPVQLVKDNMSVEYLYINEKVFTIIFVTKMMAEIDIKYFDTNLKLESFFELIYYNFKYRIFTQKTLETVVSAFFCGSSFNYGGRAK